MNNASNVDRYVVEVLMRDLVGHDRRGASFMIYLYLLVLRDGKAVTLSHQQMATATGLSKRTVQNAIAHLHQRGLVELEKRGRTVATTLRPLSPWRR